MKRYAIETQFINTWENCWTDGEGRPVTFATKQEAQAELRQHLADMAQAEADGDISDAMSADEFRIAEVIPCA